MTAPSAALRLPGLRTTPGAIDVLVVGPYFCDIVYAGVPRLPGPGEEVWSQSCTVVPGGTYVTAVALHRLEVSSTWVTCFGTDPFSRLASDAAAQEGMDPRGHLHTPVPLPNLSVSISVGSERSFVSYATPPAGDLVGHAIDQLRRLRPRIMVLPGVMARADAPLFGVAAEVGALCYIDPQADADELDEAELNGLLEHAAVFAPNRREADALGVDAERTRRVSALVVVKDGENGATALAAGEALHRPAMAVDPVDTTGAGDCFNAGFIAGWLSGLDLSATLDFANAAGALSTRAPSSDGAPRLAAVKQALQDGSALLR